MKSNWVIRLMLFTVVCFGLAGLFAKMAGDEKITGYWQKVADKLTNRGNFVSVFTQENFAAENFSALNITGTEHDVRFEKSKDGDIHFSYYKKNEGPKIELLKIEGATAYIDLNKLNSPKNRFKINFNFNSDENPGFNVQEVNQSAIVIQVPENIKMLKVETVSGEIKSSDLKFDETVIRSVSGNLKLQGDLKALNLTTVSGDIKLEIENFEPDVKMETVSGDIKIGFERHPGFKLTFSTTSGSVKIDKAFGGADIDGNVKDLKIGSGGGRLAISTVSGDLEIEKSAGNR